MHDVMLDRSFYRTMPKSAEDTANTRMYGGLQLKVGVVYKVNKKNMTVTIGNYLKSKVPTATLGMDPYRVDAMILSPTLGMQMNDLGMDKFSAAVEFPVVGSHVVYANLYGFEGGPDTTVCLGSIFPLQFAYNAIEMSENIKRAFVDLAARKVIESPTGYFWYETDEGEIHNGFIDYTLAPVTRLVWEEVWTIAGDYTRTVYNPAGAEVYTLEQAADGSFSLTNFGGAAFGFNAAGLFELKNQIADLKLILKDVQGVLANAILGTNWIGNYGAPLVYTLAATDIPKMVDVSAKIDALFQ